MVKEVDGQGGHFGDWLRRFNTDLSRREIIRFRQGSGEVERERKILERLSGQLGKESTLLINVTDASRHPLHILLVPQGNRDRLLERGGDQIMPEEGETFLAVVYNRRNRRISADFLIVVEDPEDVVPIAKSQAEKRFRWKAKNLEVESRPISPSEFIEIARQQIDQGIRLPGRILRFDDLANYAEKVTLANLRLTSKSPTS